MGTAASLDGSTGASGGSSHGQPQIPEFELLRCIGRSGDGEVWLARNVVGTYRSVKVVYRARFTEARPYEREFDGIKNCEPISRQHEGLVDILQVGRNDAAGYFYYVMDLADDASGHQKSEVTGPKSKITNPAFDPPPLISPP